MQAAQRMVLKYLRTKFALGAILSKPKTAKQAFDAFCTPQFRHRPKLPPVFEQAEQLRFDWEDFRIRGYRWAPEAKTKLLIIHCFESSVARFDQYIGPLLEKGYGVLAFDAPAHGYSSGKRTNVKQYIEFLAHIEATFGPIQRFFAHSLGGLALMLLLERWQDRPGLKAALVAPATESRTAADYFFHVLRIPATVRPYFEAHVESIAGKPLSWYSAARAAPLVSADILWVHDRDDRQTPWSDAQPVLEANHPHIEFVVTDGLGHSRIYRDPVVRKRIVNFL